MGFCFPGYDDKGSDLPPRRECAPHWRERVMVAMPQVELILAIGQYAQAFHLGERRRKTMTETVQNWRSYLHANSGPGIFPLPHPSWRNTGWLKRTHGSRRSCCRFCDNMWKCGFSETIFCFSAKISVLKGN